MRYVEHAVVIGVGLTVSVYAMAALIGSNPRFSEGVVMLAIVGSGLTAAAYAVLAGIEVATRHGRTETDTERTSSMATDAPERE